MASPRLYYKYMTTSGEKKLLFAQRKDFVYGQNLLSKASFGKVKDDYSDERLYDMAHLFLGTLDDALAQKVVTQQDCNQFEIAPHIMLSEIT